MKAWAIAFLLALSSALPARAETIWSPLPREAYAFGKKYPDAQRLLFGFDYGHALIYEGLLLNRGTISDPDAFEQALLKRILAVLRNPPSIKPDENDIAPSYTYGFPLTVNLFDWSHYLHQFVYDILVTYPDQPQMRQRRSAEVFTQYQASPVAMTAVCKTMLYMDGHYFSKAFRRQFPSLNLLIWSYHWFQVALYEALMLPTEAERDQGVAAALREFWGYVSSLPDSAPFDDMPMTADVAPKFTAEFPVLPGAFDNLHMLHDVVSDLLTSDKVGAANLKSEAIRFGRMGQDPDAFRANRCPSH